MYKYTHFLSKFESVILRMTAVKLMSKANKYILKLSHLELKTFEPQDYQPYF